MNGASQVERLWLRLAMMVFAVGVLFYRDNIMDDTWIHLQYARNLRLHGELAFNAGEPSLGATSPFWVLMLAAAGASEMVARLASVGFGALSVWVFAVLARRLLGNAAFAVAATVAWAGNVWLVRHAPNGMESTAAACFVLLALELRTRTRRTRRADVALGVTLAAAFLTRPETALLIAILALADLRHTRARLAVWAPVCIALCAAWLVFAWDRTGQLMAGTAGAKSGSAGDVGAGVRVLWRELRIVAAAHAVELAGFAAALGLGLRIEGARVARALLAALSLAPARLGAYAAFAVGLVVAFAALDVQVQPRYLLPALPLVTLAGFAAWRRVLGGGARAAALVAVACVAWNGTVSAVRVLPPTRSFARGLRPAMAPLAAEITSRATPTSRVATPDIGYIGFHTTTPVLDLGGLTDPAMLALRERVGDAALLEEGAFLERAAADFIIDRSLERERFAGHATRGKRWTPLRTTTLPNLGLTRPGPYHYTLYALEDDDAPRSSR